MALDRTILVTYAEIGVKGGNRGQFERRLGDRLREALANAGIAARVRFQENRHHVAPADPAQHERALRVVTRVPGVAHAAPVVCVPREIPDIVEAAAVELAAAPPGTFKVETHRTDKGYPLTSIDLSRAVAPLVAERSGRTASVKDPDLTVRIDVLSDRACVSARRVPGPGGLPVGSTTRLLSFLSGGLDSAVSTWMMLRRGARVTAVHFHNRSHQGTAVLEKLEDICTVLAWAAGEMPLVVVPFEACQRAIVAACPPPLRMIVYRRAMFRIASRLADAEDALGYVTGDSLGQVASQTAENILVVQEAADRPVYAPLIGHDKVEIVALARKIGTYEISIRPHADCCSFLIASHPTTRARLGDVERIEAAIAFDALVEEAVAGAERRLFRPDPATA